jgi:hypothetical protein
VTAFLNEKVEQSCGEVLMDKVILTAATTRAATVATLTPYFPLTPKEIDDSAVEAAHAGAAVLSNGELLFIARKFLTTFLFLIYI